MSEGTQGPGASKLLTSASSVAQADCWYLQPVQTNQVALYESHAIVSATESMTAGIMDSLLPTTMHRTFMANRTREEILLEFDDERRNITVTEDQDMQYQWQRQASKARAEFVILYSSIISGAGLVWYHNHPHSKWVILACQLIGAAMSSTLMDTTAYDAAAATVSHAARGYAELDHSIQYINSDAKPMTTESIASSCERNELVLALEYQKTKRTIDGLWALGALKSRAVCIHDTQVDQARHAIRTTPDGVNHLFDALRANTNVLEAKGAFLLKQSMLPTNVTGIEYSTHTVVNLVEVLKSLSHKEAAVIALRFSVVDSAILFTLYQFGPLFFLLLEAFAFCLPSTHVRRIRNVARVSIGLAYHHLMVELVHVFRSDYLIQKRVFDVTIGGIILYTMVHVADKFIRSTPTPELTLTPELTPELTHTHTLAPIPDRVASHSLPTPELPLTPEPAPERTLTRTPAPIPVRVASHSLPTLTPEPIPIRVASHALPAPTLTRVRHKRDMYADIVVFLLLM